MNKSILLYLALVGINLIYACTAIFTKMAAQQDVMSLPYLLWIVGAVGVMGLYALLWQQVIARMPVSTAYMFKGTSLIFVLIFSVILFNETITLSNIIGSVVIVAGILLYARADESANKNETKSV